MKALGHDGRQGNIVSQQVHAVDIRKAVTSVPGIGMLRVGRWQVDFLMLHARLDKKRRVNVHATGF